MEVLAERYEVVERLGRGGMGVVLLARDRRLGRQVAIKRMHAEMPDEVARRFEREARMGANLSHPNLVSIYDIVTEADDVLIVMEYVAGRTLSQRLKAGRLGARRGLRILGGVADALDYAHRKGIVHRDVKPSNVLVGEEDRVKLADLGIATATEDTSLTRSGAVVGTPAYMAPEQLQGGEITSAVDIYALAAVAYEALSGVKPRDGRSPLEIAHRTTSEPPPDLRQIWPDAPDAAAEALSQAMCRDPDGRPESAGALLSQLEDAFAGTADDVTAETRIARGLAAGAAGAAAAGGAAGAAGAGAGNGGYTANTPTPVHDGATPADTSPGPDTGQTAALPATGAVSRPPTDRAADTRPPRRPEPAVAGPSTRSRGTRRRGPLLAVAALIGVLALVGVGAAVFSGGSDDSPAPAEDAQQADESQAAEGPAVGSSDDAAAADQQAAPSDVEDPAAEGGKESAAEGARLNDEGFALLQAGNAEEASKVLGEAVKAFPDGTSDINYAFALFNYGRALRLAGKPEQAIPVLEERLTIPNQTGVVQKELDAARAAAGGGGKKEKNGKKQ
ncbi:MAG: protein kinase domain-containing protein [Solirubrobacterales bacterium]